MNGTYDGIVSKRVEISAAHWLPFHDGKCKHLHGHNYIFEITVYGLFSETDPDQAFVIDFSKLKKIIHDTIMEWDHALLTHYTVEELREIFQVQPIGGGEVYFRDFREWGIEYNKVIPLGVWSTAENLSRIACHVIERRLRDPGKVLAVSATCWETSDSSASYTLSSPPTGDSL